MPESFLEINGIEAGYGDVRVLWDISLSVEKGEIACIVGSNGAGKTTLLNTISGIVKPTAGSIKLDGQELVGCLPDAVLKTGIAHVPEGRRLFKGLSVQDNLMLGAYLRDDRESIREDLSFVYDLFPILKERSTQDATTMSGGEQQMCAIGRGIMSKPRLLMIDELSLGLAPRLVDRLGDTLLEINKSGLTILLVEQDVMTAFEIAKRAFVIETGRVSISGSTAELGNDPKIKEAYMGI
ncbi:MAG: branched-chain amino acid ABC transporter ATP-binding protein [Rhodospirillaceae bacterium]|jgi:branched-chain amino acid transport system ATP-binding protein|uniref:ABC transporter ATP-binding protein n=1 Tax=unclassified Hwanghaeella TaxID=2605944 RepID=UPI000C579B2B|nr:branched-chain amino acid ABC transporter ATP-binding protein [Rhodospirillales bacterium]MAX47698.1 branched-chain amino acid ABC transporter ATP-binding protein [Rhodospirillaceae bacterium]|tara:strand:- start:64857 stop:65573 length:717 start_codon:yes stop_codon:yes gene_type:complete